MAVTVIDTTVSVLAGDTRTLAFTAVDETGVPVDFTTATAVEWGISVTPTAAVPAPRPLVSKSLGSEVYLAEGRTDQVRVELTETDTNRAPGRYPMQLRARFGTRVFSVDPQYVLQIVHSPL